MLRDPYKSFHYMMGSKTYIMTQYVALAIPLSPLPPQNKVRLYRGDNKLGRGILKMENKKRGHTEQNYPTFATGLIYSINQGAAIDIDDRTGDRRIVDEEKITGGKISRLCDPPCG